MADPGGSGSGVQDPFEMFRRLWAPLGLPVPGMAMPTLDPAEVEKRIADLKSVETWLAMNLNMVKMAIQGLEVQKMALTAMKATVRETPARRASRRIAQRAPLPRRRCHSRKVEREWRLLAPRCPQPTLQGPPSARMHPRVRPSMPCLPARAQQ